MILDDVLPQYTIRSHHSRHVRAQPDRVYAAVKSVRSGEIPVIGLLFWFRRLPARLMGAPKQERETGRPLLDALVSGGFLLLGERGQEEVVVGTAGQPWKAEAVLNPPASREEFIRYNVPNTVKVAMNLTVTGESDTTTLLRTETRIFCTDADATRTFRRYWRMIGMGSGLIRVLWLRAIARKAQQQA